MQLCCCGPALVLDTPRYNRGTRTDSKRWIYSPKLQSVSRLPSGRWFVLSRNVIKQRISPSWRGLGKESTMLGATNSHDVFRYCHIVPIAIGRSRLSRDCIEMQRKASKGLTTKSSRSPIQLPSSSLLLPPCISHPNNYSLTTYQRLL